jgi:twitching motility protein PilI
MNTADPFDLLLDLEKRTVEASIASPVLEEIEDEWVGIGFRIGDSRLITSMSDVKEILELPDVTSVPGVKTWVVGIANVRGSLLPIMDMRSFLLDMDVKQKRKGRVIVIDYKGYDTGLVVDEIYGMRHFRESEQVGDEPQTHDNILPYINSVYRQEAEDWPVFDFSKMIDDERFAKASL